MVMVDLETGAVAFVDQSAKSGPPPLGLPKGSVRALVALATMATALVLVARGDDLPGMLTSLLLTITGFYFGFRTKSSTLSDRLYDPTATRELPLFLPPGVIRLALVLGFIVAGALLASRGKLRPVREHAEFFAIIAGLVAGHFFTKMLRGAGGAAKAAFGHVKALAVLAISGLLTAAFIFGTDWPMPPWSVTGLCVAVSFYYGSRS